MRKLQRAFSLIELLVVIATIAILAGILFPVFTRAKAAARKAACLTYAKQYGLAASMYISDSDETYPPSQYRNRYDANPRDPDAMVGNLLAPYHKNYTILASPGDPATDYERISLPRPTPASRFIPADLVPAYRQEQANLNRAIKSDFGMNWLYYSPTGNECGRWGDSTYLWKPFPINSSKVQATASSIYAVNSVWSRNRRTGKPEHGGNWIVDAPGRYLTNGTDTMGFPPRGCEYYWSFGGWAVRDTLSWLQYGGVWPWHSGFATTLFADGHAKALTLGALSDGVRNPDVGWPGPIVDREKYLWDLE